MTARLAVVSKGGGSSGNRGGLGIRILPCAIVSLPALGMLQAYPDTINIGGNGFVA